ncbi:hypothetical protein, partial [Azotobacter chroococcum]|uniref:hypothetical protein n=1 Tax=Azotobacter chroococcum TaxID=353 RepID=UPI001B8B615F
MTFKRVLGVLAAGILVGNVALAARAPTLLTELMEASKDQPFQGVCVNSPDDQAGGQDDVGCDSGAFREAGTGQRHGTAGA